MATQWNGVVTTRTSPLNVRSGPSTSSPVIGSLPKGSTVVLTDITEVIAGCKWGKHTALGRVGYSCVWASNLGTCITVTPVDGTTSTTPESTPVEEEPVDPVPETDWSVYAGNGVDRITADQNVDSFRSSAVMYDDRRLPVSAHYSESVPSSTFKKGVVKTTSVQPAPVNQWDSPEYVQNSKGWPPVVGRTSSGRYIYDYSLDYGDFSDQLSHLDIYNNMTKRTVRSAYLADSTNYNRFKTANPNTVLSRAFSHVFFLRPDLNILQRSGSDWGLADGVADKSQYYYVWKSNPTILKELVRDTYPNHDFMLTFSNAAKSFQLSDEFVETDTAGQSYLGYKVPYSKTNAASKVNGSFDVEMSDNRDLDIYRTLKIWTDYMSDVYRGIITPQDKYVLQRQFDYTTVAYYIMCREDNETIIFWSKY